MNQFKLTEWEWFKVQLRLHALEYSTSAFGERYQFNATVPNITVPPRKISAEVVCSVYGEQVQSMIEKGTSREEQLAYYWDWIAGQKQVMEKILEELPDLRSKLDLSKDVAYVIVYNYGMGGCPVCTFVNGDIYWSEAASSFVVSKRRRRKK
jgi:hypothetical protein